MSQAAMPGESVRVFIKKIALVGCCLIVLGAIRVALTVVRFRNLRPYLPKGMNDNAPPAMCARIAQAVTLASKAVPGATCLPQALTAQIMLALRGYASEVQIGVQMKADGQFGAHAWLTCGDWIVIGGSPASVDGFEPLVELAPY